MATEYYVIDSSSVVESVVVVEDGADMGVLYPGKTVVEVMQGVGVKRAYAGCLYSDSKFWAPYLDMNVEVPKLTHFEFRELFTDAELVDIDNFATDDVLSVEDKKSLTSLTKSFDSAMVIDLSNAKIIGGLGKLVDVDYLTSERRDAILNNEVV
jgi:hypothetical protein